MNKLVLLSATLLAIASPVFGQTKTSVDPKLEAHIITLEKQGWKAWQDGNGAWYRDNTTADFVSTNHDGPTNKADLIKAAPTACHLKSYSLTDFKIVMLDENALILSYAAKQDEICGTERVPPSVHAMSTYVRRNGRWLTASYMETP